MSFLLEFEFFGFPENVFSQCFSNFNALCHRAPIIQFMFLLDYTWVYLVSDFYLVLFHPKQFLILEKHHLFESRKVLFLISSQHYSGKNLLSRRGKFKQTPIVRLQSVSLDETIFLKSFRKKTFNQTFWSKKIVDNPVGWCLLINSTNQFWHAADLLPAVFLVFVQMYGFSRLACMNNLAYFKKKVYENRMLWKILPKKQRWINFKILFTSCKSKLIAAQKTPFLQPNVTRSFFRSIILDEKQKV